jgi:glucose-1-phosphate thymidylyltransferase
MRIAKALVLAGPTPHDRPWPSVRTTPKPLVPVANRPILFHHLDALRQAGLLEATIAVVPESAPAIRSAVGNGRDWGLRIDYAECAAGLALDEVLSVARGFVAGEPVLVQRVGALMRERIHPHIDAFAGERLDAMALRLPGPAHPGEPDGEDGGWLLSERAVSILTHRRPAVADLLACVRDDGGQVRMQEVDGCLLCHGGQDTLLEANRRMLEQIVTDVDPDSLDASVIEGAVIVHPTARIERSLIRGPAIIGPRTRLTSAYVGPYTSVGPDVVIEGSEVEHSIIFSGAELRYIDGRLETSIIGQRARVMRSFAVPKALRLSIGDGAEVGLS